jgi:hypothetical protein
VAPRFTGRTARPPYTRAVPSNSRPGVASTGKGSASKRRAPDPAQPRPVPILLRYISCGLLSLIGGAAWRFTLSPNAVGIVTAFAGIFFLLLGFLVGGVFWYAHDVRTRARHPELMPDERMVFSFVVFVMVPFAVLAFIGVIWLLALLIGVH